MEDAREFFSEAERMQIKEAIAEAEAVTSGEIRVHVELRPNEEIAERAHQVFEEIGMADTKLRNGVLLYIACDEGRFVIIGDTGIDDRVPEDFWDHIRDEVVESFNEGDFLDGTLYFIEETGEHLAEYFPHEEDDVNELPDTISFGD